MIRKFLLSLILCSFFVTSLVPAQSWAQDGDPYATSETSSTRRHLATIMFSGLAGTILGISTLSFYGRPQDKLTNVAIGLAIGIMVGAAYTTYKTATQPYDYYGEEALGQTELEKRHTLLSSTQAQPINLGYSWSF